MLKAGHHLSDAELRARYDALPRRGGLGPEFLRRALALAGDLRGLRVIDVGCGKGELLAEAAARRSGARLYGVDFSAVRLGYAAVRDGARVSLVEADIQRSLPFADQTFDRVFCTETLEHLREPVRCLVEIRRVLRDDGRAIITVPNATGFAPFHWLAPVIPGRWLRRKLLPYEHPDNTDQPIDTCFGYGEIAGLIRAGGFEVERVDGWRYFRYLQMLPVTREIYRWMYPAVEWLMARLGAERFAYNVLFLCRKRG